MPNTLLAEYLRHSVSERSRFLQAERMPVSSVFHAAAVPITESLPYETSVAFFADYSNQWLPDDSGQVVRDRLQRLEEV